MVCPTCKTAVPETAPSCPKCGAPSIPIDEETVSLHEAVQDWSRQTINLPPEPKATLEPGSVLGDRYELLEGPFEGGMGAVFKARDREVDRLVALKVIRPELVGRKDVLRRFRQELVLARQVTHRNVVRIYDLGVAGGVRFITMEYIEGRELAVILKERGKLQPEEAAEIMLQVCRGLAAAHAEGVVHRDLKPQNIMVDHQGRVAVMDFGIANSIAGAQVTAEATAAQDTTTAGDLTKIGALIGTPRYMSPEQANREKVDHRSDLFTVGLILCELLAGKLPKQPKDLNTALKNRATIPMGFPAEADPGIPDALKRIVIRCLALDADERYQKADEIVEDLEFFLGIREKNPARITRTQLAAAIVAIGAMIAGSTYAYLRLRPAPAQVKPAVKVVVADFTNSSGDPLFNGTLEPMMNTALEGASFINAFDRGEAHKIAHRLTGASTFSEPAARLVAVREGIGVVITGSIRRVGSGYGVSARAIDASNGRVLTERSARAPKADDVPKAVATISAGIRKSLGDATPEGAQVAAAETFSSKSLEASQRYALGQQLQWEGKWDEAIKAYQRSIELDPDLGRAYAGLAATLSNIGRKEDAGNMYRLAMSKIDRMSDREKYRTRGGYYLWARNYKQAIEQFKALTTQYPADTAGSAGLAMAYFYQRNMQAALEEGRRALAIFPNNLLNLNNVGLFAMYAGDFATAEAESRKLLSMNPKFQKAWVCLGLSLLGQGKVEEANGAYRKLDASEAAMGLADVALYEGRLQDAATELANSQSDAREALQRVMLAGVWARQKKNAQAIKAAGEAAAVSHDESVLYPAAIVFLEAGNEKKSLGIAEKLSARLEAEPQAYAKLIEAEVSLGRGDAREAVKQFQAAQAFADTWLGRFGLGRAYLELKAYTEADTEFDVCLKRRGEATAVFLDDEPSYHYLPPVYYYQGLAREGLQSPGAAQSFEEFLKIREKSARDPMVEEAKKRLHR